MFHREADPVDHRLEKLKRAREVAREKRDSFSILQLLISSLRGFLEFQLTLEQLEESIDETSETLDSLLEQLELQPHASPVLILNLERAAGITDDYLQGEELTESEAEKALQALLSVEEKLKAFSLGDYFHQAKQSRQKFDLTKAAMSKIQPWELEVGHYDRVADTLDDFFLGLADVEGVLEFLEELYQDTLERLDDYNNTVIRPEEWTLEVALADEFMTEGFELWLDGIEDLCALCTDDSINETSVLEALEALRQGNRYWVTVEKLSEPAITP